jgi:hypothetical protein
MFLFTLEQITNEWEDDAEVNQVSPENDLLYIPVLHSKYASQMVYQKSDLQKKRISYDELLRTKLDYYNGRFDKKDYDDKEWAVFQHKLKGKDDLNAYLAADKDLNKIRNEMNECENVIEFCESVVKQLESRTFQIKGYLDWQKYKLGS